MFELPSFFCSKKNERKSHKKVCENKDFFHDLMPFEDIKIPELNQYQKPDKALFNIYADLGYSIKKIDGCRSNPENSSTTYVGEHIPSIFQCLQYHYLKAQKKISIYAKVKIV